MRYFVFGITGIAGMLVLFALYNPALLAFIAVHIALSAVNISILNKKQYELDKRQLKWQRFADYYHGLVGGKGSAKELRIYRLKPFIFDRWIKFYEKLRLERLDLELEGTRNFNRYSLVKFFLWATALAVLFWGIYNKRCDIGVFVMLFGLVNEAMEKITGLVSKIMSGVIKDTKYLCDFYDFVHTVDGAKIKVSQKLDAQDAPLALGPFESLELKNISFTYPQSNKKALNTVSLTIQKGEIISILGYNGSGKTTLSKILNGSFSPQEGSVRLNGVELDDNTRRELFLYTGSGPQEFPRFSLSIRELVGLGRIEKAEDGGELRRAYAKAGLNDLLVKFKNGDGALLGKEYDPAGVELSGGEWQRLVIASAYMGGPELLILDEPTASIDPLTEMEVIKNLRENMEGKTAVLISHRIGFARMAGRIIMMENGTITEDGSHEELLEKGGYYAALFNEQKKLYMGDSRA